MRKLLKVLRWMGWSVLALVVAALIAYGVIYVQASVALRREVNLLQRQGISTHIADYVPPKVPESENAAWLYRKVFPIARRAQYDLPGLTGKVSSGPSTLTHADWAQMRKGVAQAKGALPLIKDALRRPHCQFPVQWEKGYDALFPDMGGMRECARLLRYEALLSEKQGERGALIRASGDLLRMGEQVGEDPSLINQLVSYPIDDFGLRALEHGLAHSSVSPGEAKELFDQLSRVDLGPGFTRAFQMERPVAMQWFDQARARKHSQREWLENWPGTGIGSEPTPWLYVLPGGTGLNADEAVYLRLTRRFLELTPLPYREAKGPLEALGREADRSPGYAVLSFMWFSERNGWVGPRLLARRDTYTAKIALAQAALAVKAYQAQTGRKPRSLSEVQKTLGWKLREDPFSGRSLRFRADSKGFLVYSIGPDLRDNGGQPQKHDYADAPGDLVWRSTWEPVAWREAPARPQVQPGQGGPMGPGAGPTGPVGAP